MNRYPTWKNLLVLAVVVFGLFIALPNLFGEDPALQVSRDSGAEMVELEFSQVSLVLQEGGVDFSSVYEENGRALVRFASVEDQLRASDLLREELGKAYVVALTLAPRTPGWLRTLGLKPMSLGLDLRGGVHFLFEVDIDAAVQQRLTQYETDFDKLLRENRIKRKTRLTGNEIRILLGDPANADEAERLITDSDPDVDIDRSSSADGITLRIRMTEDQVRQRRDFAIQQNTVTLRNRVNELGVAEPLVQRQGLDRIVVQLPGDQRCCIRGKNPWELPSTPPVCAGSNGGDFNGNFETSLGGTNDNWPDDRYRACRDNQASHSDTLCTGNGVRQVGRPVRGRRACHVQWRNPDRDFLCVFRREVGGNLRRGGDRHPRLRHYRRRLSDRQEPGLPVRRRHHGRLRHAVSAALVAVSRRWLRRRRQPLR